MSQQQLRTTRIRGTSIENESLSISMPCQRLSRRENRRILMVEHRSQTCTRIGRTNRSIEARGVEQIASGSRAPRLCILTGDDKFASRLARCICTRAKVCTAHEYMHAKECTWLYWIRQLGMAPPRISSSRNASRHRLPYFYRIFISTCIVSFMLGHRFMRRLF